MKDKQVSIWISSHVKTIYDFLIKENVDVLALAEINNLPNSSDFNNDNFFSGNKVMKMVGIAIKQLPFEKQVELCQVTAKTNLEHMVSFLRDDHVYVKDVIGNFIENADLYASNADFSCETWLKDVWISRQRTYRGEDWYAISDCYVICIMIELVRWITKKPEWLPSKIQLESDATPYISALFPNRRFEFYIHRDRTGISLPKELIHLECSAKVSQHNNTIEKNELTFSQIITTIIKPYLYEGRPSLERVSEICGMTPRTLQRRLKHEGVTYSTLLDNLIFNQAREELICTEKSIVDISVSLGYGLATHFTRSFKKHFGMTPKQYRSWYLQKQSPL